jgi:hypothetical protein
MSSVSARGPASGAGSSVEEIVDDQASPAVMEDEMADRSEAMRVRLHRTLLHIATTLPASVEVGAANLALDDEDFPLAVKQLSLAVKSSDALNDDELGELRAVARELKLWGVVARLTP